MATLADRGLDLLLHNTAKYTYKDADLVLKPVYERINSFHVKKALRLIEMGKETVYQNIKTIQNLLA